MEAGEETKKGANAINLNRCLGGGGGVPCSRELRCGGERDGIWGRNPPPVQFDISSGVILGYSRSENSSSFVILGLFVFPPILRSQIPISPFVSFRKKLTCFT